MGAGEALESGSGDTRPRGSRHVLAALLSLLLFGVVLLGAWWTHPPDPASELRAHFRPLVALERTPAPELGRGFERWRMIGGERDTVNGLWRAAPEGREVRWSAVILGGLETDQKAALLIPDSLPVHVLAVSWPWRGARHMGRLEFLRNVPAIHEALLRTPGAMARGVEAVRRAAPGDRVVLLGASLGAAPAASAASLERPDALALVDGAADLRRLLESETRNGLGRGVSAALLAPAAGAVAARLLSSLEPARHGGAARGLPVLIVDAESESRYPPACVARLHAAYPAAALATHPGPHMSPERPAQIAEIVDIVWRWLGTLGGP